MERNTEIEDRTTYYQAMFQRIKAMVPEQEVALVFLQEIRKDMRMDRMNRERGGSAGDSPATGSQIAYLEKLGVAIPENLTKKDASKLIDQALGHSSPRKRKENPQEELPPIEVIKVL